MADDGKLAAMIEQVTQRGRAYASAGDPVCADYERLLGAVNLVLALHRPFDIYDECDHEHTDEDVAAGRAVDTPDFRACHEVFMYSICAECCTEPEYGQTELCAGDHRHGPGQPVCATAAAISRALLGEDAADA